jgi:transcriptional regulator with XRE-family HTH domain
MLSFVSPDRDPLKAVGEFIRTQRRLADMSLRQLAGLAKVSNPYLSQVERGIYKPSADVLKRLASALHLQAETLYSKAGLLEDEPGEGPSVEEAIKLDLRLDTDQKETLIRVYRGLIGS